MISLSYNGREIPVPLPEGQILQTVEANRIHLPEGTPEELVEQALEHPVGAPPLEAVIAPGETVCIVISDITRKWQSPAVYLPVLVERLNRLGVPDGNILILSATGVHRRQTEAEWAQLLGPDLMVRLRHEDHRCDETENLRFLGTTSRGTPVWVNARALACDRLILTGGVAYHPLAGFSGGRKSLVPGIAGRETIDRNHSLALNPGPGSGVNPNADGGNITRENPFHDDQAEAAAMARPDYLLNIVADDRSRIIAAFAGDWMEAWLAAVRLLERRNRVEIPCRVPLVVAGTGGSPRDMNLSQTTKTLANALHALTPGGTLILASQCREGIGDPNCESVLCNYTSMEEREAALRKRFTIGGFFGYLFARTGAEHHFIFITDIPAERFSATQIHAVGTMEEALEMAAAFNGGSLEGLPAIILPNGAATMPHPPEC